MKILLATDGTEHSEKAVAALDDFKLDCGSTVKVVSIVDLALPLAIDIYEGYLPSTTEIEANAKENANKLVESTRLTLAGKFPDCKIETEVLYGSPESNIVEAAENMNADLIVVGSHGYNRWERLLLGSVSDSVVHHAPCSVLVVR
jgi:nucleotide-binding universal stress UspA family protein